MYTESSTNSNIETDNNDNTSHNLTIKVIPKINTNSGNASAKNAYDKDSDKHSRREDSMATYTLLLTIFTGLLVFCNFLLWLPTKKSADIAKKSIELIKQEFVATHRPKLRVHSIFLKKIDPPPKLIGGSNKDHQLYYSVSNIGESPATITKKSMVFKRLKHPLPIPSYSDPNLSKKTIACGESISGSLSVEHFLISQAEERELDDLYFFGYIDYLDNIGTTRRTAFCRRYIHETKRFTKVDDEDYEYSY